MPPKESLKRKQPQRKEHNAGPYAKRPRVIDARTILTQSGEQALNEKGELDLHAFVRVREFEIEALEKGIVSSKHGLSTRAFQQVPRDMRRRTASHNAKKVPRRLRNRAAREMKEDNTPTGSERKKDLNSKQRLRRETAKRAAVLGAKAKVQREKLTRVQKDAAQEPAEVAKAQAQESVTVSVNKGKEAPAAIHPINPPQHKKDVLSTPKKPVTKFRKRQKEKTWLPTHMFHAKRAHMTLPSRPLWGFSLPLSPTERVYRTTHRAANLRGCVAWDTSYMGSVMIEGDESSLLNTMRGLGVPEEMLTADKGKRWRLGGRGWNGWLRDRDKPDQHIAPALIVWCTVATEDSAETVDSESSRTRRKALVRIHPAGFRRFWDELLKVTKMQRPKPSVVDLRYDIGSIEIDGPAATEALAGIMHPISRSKNDDYAAKVSTVLSTLGSISTPAAVESDILLNLSISDPRLFHPPRPLDTSKTSEKDILDLQTKWLMDEASSHSPIFDSTARFASCRLQSSQKAIHRRKGAADPGEYPEPLDSDPQIPALLCSVGQPSGKSHHRSWVLLLPWHWVLPVWNSLMYFPLSSGGNPRFGGLQERRQLAFERNEPCYPADFPGTEAGFAWEEQERARRKEEHERKPKGKRNEYASLDLGNGTKGEHGDPFACDWELFRNRAHESSAAATDNVLPEKSNSGPKQDATKAKGIAFSQVFRHQLLAPDFNPAQLSLLTVRLRYVQRGVPATCARIYGLPVPGTDLRNEWLAHLSPEDARQLSGGESSLSTMNEGRGRGKKDHPRIPGVENVIGFVTAGNFNLGEGSGTAVGCIALERVWSEGRKGTDRVEGLCIVRNVGTTHGRLARWTAV